ncbi:hypothetical protein A2U01_0069565, partial [Trifolium medium]|nr:hypothetical protein [Trifolium medium]
MSSPPTIEELVASINTFIINQQAFQNHITDEIGTLLKPQAYQHPIHNNHRFADPVYASHKTFNQHYDFSNPPSTYTSSLTPYTISHISTHPSPWST